MNSWMKKLERIGPNNTGSFKYIFPCEVYELIDYTILRHRDFLTEFFTDSPQRSKILHYLEDKGYYNVNMEYEPHYNCYCIEVVDPAIRHTLEVFYDPFHYMGQDVYFVNALKLGYTNRDEIERDYCEYHDRIGRQFQDIGLLPKNTELRFKL